MYQAGSQAGSILLLVALRLIFFLYSIEYCCVYFPTINLMTMMMPMADILVCALLLGNG